MTLTTANAKPNVHAVGSVEFRDPFPGIKAVSLNQTELTSIVPKDPNMIVRGIFNNTQRLAQAIAQGFRFATDKDCELQCSDGSRKPLFPEVCKDGRITHGDLVFMLMPKATYLGYLKNNWQKSISSIHPDMMNKNLEQELRQAMNEVPGTKSDKDKMETFHVGGQRATVATGK